MWILEVFDDSVVRLLLRLPHAHCKLPLTFRWMAAYLLSICCCLSCCLLSSASSSAECLDPPTADGCSRPSSEASSSRLSSLCCLYAASSFWAPEEGWRLLSIVRTSGLESDLFSVSCFSLDLAVTHSEFHGYSCTERHSIVQ